LGLLSRTSFDDFVGSEMTPFAMIFPGQGSQSVGMLQAWGDHPAVRATLDEAAAGLGDDLIRFITEGPQDQLDLTVNTQPAMLTAGVACYRAWLHETGLAPTVVAGHSLGEYTALVAAGALRFVDALPLVRFRAQAMQNAVAVGVGAMAAILGLESHIVVQACQKIMADTGQTVEAVNFNDPKQTVIAGTRAGVDQACVLLKEQGARRALPLPVSAPFHSSLMRPAAEHLKDKLATTPFATPAVALINNIDVQEQTQAALIRSALYRQAFGPVRWVEVIQAIRARGVTHVVECGPGKVLSNLVKRCDEQAVVLNVTDPAALIATVQTLKDASGADAFHSHQG
jgi:[acyl-carrier-protein] S-malonyltransferase